MINMPKTLIDKVDNMQKQMDNIYIKKEMETQRKINQREMLEIKTNKQTSKQTKTCIKNKESF